jgi:hypothetical protein
VDRPSRELTVLGCAHRARYTSLVAAVAPTIESSLSPAVAANRVAACRVWPPVLRLQPWRAERWRFARRLSSLAVAGGCLVLADVCDCYGSIDPGVVEEVLRGLGCGRGDSAGVRRFLVGLSRVGIRGLPVGPDPSAVLANAVLSRVDSALQGQRVRHLRWVDDVVISAEAPHDAPGLLDVLRQALETVGLRLNEGKTRVVIDPADVGGSGALSAARSRARVG